MQAEVEYGLAPVHCQLASSNTWAHLTKSCFSNNFKINVFPLLNNADVVSQPVIACKNKRWRLHLGKANKLSFEKISEDC